MRTTTPGADDTLDESDSPTPFNIRHHGAHYLYFKKEFAQCRAHHITVTRRVIGLSASPSRSTSVRPKPLCTKQKENTMERQMVRYLASVILAVICFLAIGVLILTPQIFNPRTTYFTFTIFGVCAVFMFNALRFEPRKTLIFVAAIILLASFILAFRNSTVALAIRNLLWFLFIVGGAYMTSKAIRHPSMGNPSVLGLVMWTGAFALIYLVMTFLNIFVFRFYPIGVEYERVTISASWYFARAFRIGAVLGFGIGIGFVVSNFVERASRAARAA